MYKIIGSIIICVHEQVAKRRILSALLDTGSIFFNRIREIPCKITNIHLDMFQSLVSFIYLRKEKAAELGSSLFCSFFVLFCQLYLLILSFINLIKNTSV